MRGWRFRVRARSSRDSSRPSARLPEQGSGARRGDPGLSALLRISDGLGRGRFAVRVGGGLAIAVRIARSAAIGVGIASHVGGGLGRFVVRALGVRRRILGRAGRLVVAVLS